MKWIDGSSVDAYAPCPCGVGQKFKWCCYKLAAESLPASFELGQFLIVEDLWPAESREVPSLGLINDFDPMDLVYTLAKINWMLDSQYPHRAGPVELELLRRFLPEGWFRKVDLWLSTRKRWTALPRGTVILAIELAMLNVTSSDGHSVAGNETKLGKALLQVSSSRDHGDETRGRSSGAKRALLASIYRDSLRDHSLDFGWSLARHWRMVCKSEKACLARHPNGYYDFRGRYEALGGVSYEAMISAGIALWTHYKRPAEEMTSDPGHFIVGSRFWDEILPGPRPELQKAVKKVTLEWAQYVGAMNATGEGASRAVHSSLYRWPLLQLRPDVRILLDLSYLERRFTDGIYWELHDLIRDGGDPKELSTLRDNFGHVVEWHASEVLRHTLAGQEGKALWLDWDNEFSGPGRRPDAAVKEGETLFLLEVTSSAVSPAIATSGKLDLIEESLRQVWFGKGRRSAKLKQLAQCVTDFQSGALLLKRLDSAEIKNVIPIYVSLRPVPQLAALRQWYEELMRSESLPPRFIRDIMFLDIEEFEAFCALKGQGREWTALLRARQSSPLGGSSLRNFLLMSKIGMPRSEMVTQSLDEIFNDATQRMFGKPFERPT